MGQDATDALPALQQLLLADDEPLRMAMAGAIESIEGE